jgi:flagellin
MSFSINTNVASLQAMNYLAANSKFQSKTINEVTSGLRIVNSGDDAAGLAVANGYASQEAVLTQGIQNANDGLATLQTIDGGMSNISQLLNRASTLASESASGTFQGTRSVLDNEFQSVLSEINRQAQNIGMNTGGAFNKALSVFIGGGRDATGGTNNPNAVTEGSVSVDLSAAAVNTAALGLTSYQAANTSATPTALATITGGTSAGGSVNFTFSGAGFSDAANQITVTAQGVNGATSLADVVNDINNGITTAENTNPGNSNVKAFAASGIQASLNSTGTGIVFTSANAGFAVTDGAATTGNVAAQNILGIAATGLQVDAGGVQNVQLKFPAIIVGSQDVTLSTVGSNGSLVSTKVHIGALDETAAVALINTTLQALPSTNPLTKLVAVSDGTAHGNVNIMGTGAFQVFVGTPTTSGGFEDSGGNTATLSSSAPTTGGGVLDLLTAADAGTAVSAIGNAVAALGNAQAAVGRGENDLTYATNLAQSQLTNEATSESGIRDANMATEAANLTKAQILLQAGVAALAQANAAPQNILALLKS